MLLAFASLLASAMQVAGEVRENSGAPAEAAVTQKPLWTEVPKMSDLATVYPPLAKRYHVEGRAEIRCRIEITGAITNCAVASESPVGYGFGNALIKATLNFKIRPASIDGKLVAYDDFAIRTNFRLNN